jgi:hypothetical protein
MNYRATDPKSNPHVALMGGGFSQSVLLPLAPLVLAAAETYSITAATSVAMKMPAVMPSSYRTVPEWSTTAGPLVDEAVGLAAAPVTA